MTERQWRTGARKPQRRRITHTRKRGAGGYIHIYRERESNLARVEQATLELCEANYHKDDARAIHLPVKMVLLICMSRLHILI